MKLNVICEQQDAEESPSTVIREKLEEEFAKFFWDKNSSFYYGPQSAFGSVRDKNVLGLNGIADFQEMLLEYFADGVPFDEAYSKFPGLELFWQPSSGNYGSSRFKFEGFVNVTVIILRSVREIATRMYVMMEHQGGNGTKFYRNVAETLKARTLLFHDIANEDTGKYNLFRQITLKNFTEDFNAPTQELIAAAYNESIAIGCSPKFHDMPVVLSFGKGSTGAFVFVTIAGETVTDSPIKVDAGNADIGLMVSHKRIQGGMVAGLAGIPLRDIFDDLNRITTVVFSSTEPEDSEALAGISPKRIVVDRTVHSLNYLDFGPQRNSECDIEDYSNDIDSIVAYCRRNHRTKFTWWNGVKKDGSVFSSDPFEFKDTRSIFYLAEMVHDGRITINTTKGKLSAIIQLGEIISDNGLTADYFVELFYDEEVDDFEKIKEVFKEKDK